MKPHPFLIRGKVIQEIKVGELIHTSEGSCKVTKIISVSMKKGMIEVIGMCKSEM